MTQKKATGTKAPAKNTRKAAAKAETNGKAPEVKPEEKAGDNILDLTPQAEDDGEMDLSELIEPYVPDVKPDWDKVGTVEELEKELTGFKFNGPGWYTYRHDTLLVVPEERELDKMWAHASNDLETFRVYIYNGSERTPQQDFALIGSAPTRTY